MKDTPGNRRLQKFTDDLDIPEYVKSGEIGPDDCDAFWDSVEKSRNEDEGFFFDDAYWNYQFDWDPQEYVRQCSICSALYFAQWSTKDPTCGKDDCRKTRMSQMPPTEPAHPKAENLPTTKIHKDNDAAPLVWEAPSGKKKNIHRSVLELPVEYVYVVSASGMLYKIGKTNDIDKRFRGLELMSPIPLTLIHTIESQEALKLEAELHKKYNHCRSHGEWFNLSKNELDEICSM